MSTPDWIVTLATACQDTSQKAVAGQIGYSSTTVNQVLKGCYPGDIGAVEQAVRGALMDATVQCPVLGEMRMDACLHQQRKPYDNSNHAQVQLYRACRTCKNNRSRRQGQ